MKNILIIFLSIFLLVGCSKDDTKTNTTNNENTFLYENEELNFSMELPSIISDKVYFEKDSREVEDETINSIYVKYKGEENESIIIMLEEMSQDYWDKMQQEEGPKPIELGKSENNRVVVMYPLQSNPYEPNTNDFETINKFTEQSNCITETFKFN